MSTQRNQRRWERQHPIRLVKILDRFHKVRLVDDEVDLARLCNGIGAQLHSCHVASGARGTLLTASPIWSTPAGATTFDCRSAPRSVGQNRSTLHKYADRNHSAEISPGGLHGYAGTRVNLQDFRVLTHAPSGNG